MGAIAGPEQDLGWSLAGLHSLLINVRVGLVGTGDIVAPYQALFLLDDMSKIFLAILATPPSPPFLSFNVNFDPWRRW
jgi:hypothetical protein